MIKIFIMILTILCFGQEEAKDAIIDLEINKEDILKELEELNKVPDFTLQSHDGNVKVIELRRNFGQTAALAAGFDFTTGEIVITMDADGQNDPKDIPLLLTQIECGLDMVCGWRHDRKDSFWSRRFPSLIANRLISWTTDVKLHDYGCTLRAMRQEVVKDLKIFDGRWFAVKPVGIQTA